MTDALFDNIQKLLKEQKTAHYFVNLDVDKPSEKMTGADIIFRVKLNFPEIVLDKYILLQAKKYLTDKGAFNETVPGNTHLTGQIARMHSFNPEFSYLLLYSTTENPAGNIVTYRPLYGEPYWRFHPTMGEIFAPRKEFPIIRQEGNYPITVLRTPIWELIQNNAPRTLLNYSSCLPEFILNDLVTGKIGKTWDQKIAGSRRQFAFVVTLIVGQG